MGKTEAVVLLPALDEVEFKVYSQIGEDGILLYLFSLLGSSTKQVVEICAGAGRECNAANLIIKDRGLAGILFDGDEGDVAGERSSMSQRRTPSGIPRRSFTPGSPTTM